MLDELDTIIRERSISTLFQPITHLGQRAIHGYEALSRGPSGSRLHSPVTLFDTATRGSRLFELDLLCREFAMRRFQQRGLPGKLFLNATPLSLMEPAHRPGKTLEKLLELGLDPQRVVIELTEQQPMDDYDLMRQATAHYRSMGFQIAIDDLGAGYAGLRLWSELRPDYVKIDKHFIQGIHEDRVKQEFVRSIIDISKGLACRVIAEGVEIEAEYRTLYSMGIELGQGYYFSRPHPVPPMVLDAELFTCDALRSPGRSRMRRSDSVASLLREVPYVAPTTTIEKTFEIFSGTPTLDSIPVVNEHQAPMGVVRRHRLMEACAANFGRALHGNKPVARLVDPATIMVEHDTRLEQASRIITETMSLHATHDFLITREGKCIGVGRIMDLLKKITELQIRNARYANPLTLLPGNVPINEVLEELLTSHEKFAVAYCDLDNFKPFNDAYGYAKGDQVIRTVARILEANVDGTKDFIGHVGGDDFITVFTSEDAISRCDAILRQFEQEIPRIYEETDLLRGGILSRDRSGKERFYPLLTLSIGLVSPAPGACQSHHEVAALASEAKHQAKLMPGNTLFVERRRRVG